jgi:hypothetical protein
VNAADASLLNLQEEDETPSPEEPPLPAAWGASPGAPVLRAAAKARGLCQKFSREKIREVHDSDAFDIVFPGSAQGALRQCKEALVTLVEARAREAAALAKGGPFPAKISDFFRMALSDGVLLGKPEQGSFTPGIVHIRAREALPGGKLLGVVFGVRIVGGSDDVLALFERQGEGIQLAMVVANHGYESIQHGFLALDFEARPVGDRYHVMTVHSSPWISSAWRGAHFQIFAPGPSPQRPVRLLEEYNSARIGEVGGWIQAKDDGFQAQFSSWTSISGISGDVVRTHVHGFRFEQGAYRRVAPLTAHPWELPDEWLRMSWPEASLLVPAEARARLASVHEQLREDLKASRLIGPVWVKRDPGEVRVRLASAPGSPGARFVVDLSGKEPSIREAVRIPPLAAPGAPSGLPSAP